MSEVLSLSTEDRALFAEFCLELGDRCLVDVYPGATTHLEAFERWKRERAANASLLPFLDGGGGEWD
jgi:hypothetical protein